MSHSNFINLRHTLMAFALSFLALGAMNMANAASTSQGGFVSKQYQINGGWEIHKRNGQTIIKLQDGFKTKAGPDLKLFLSKNSISNSTGRNATSGVLVSKLKKSSGSQEYVLPKNINIEDYNSLLIHCEKFSVLWGGSNI